MSQKTIDLLIYLGKAALVFVIGFIIALIVVHLVKKALKKSRLDPAAHTFVVNVVRVILWVVLLVVIISYFGIPTAPFVTVLGACGAAIALALKDSLGNVAGGIVILVTHPFDRGDFVEIGSISGFVESIDILTTTLKTRDNKIVTAPNGKVNTSMIVNWDRADVRRVDCRISVSYDDDLSEARKVQEELAAECPYAIETPPPFIGVREHGDSSIVFDYFVWCKTEHYWDLKYYLEENIARKFKEKGITIPYPQIDVHVKENGEEKPEK